LEQLNLGLFVRTIKYFLGETSSFSELSNRPDSFIGSLQQGHCGGSGDKAFSSTSISG